MGKTLPYCVTLSNIPKYFEKIRQAKVPERFTYEFLKKTLGFTGGNDQMIVSVLKKLGFIDGSGVPLQRYRDFRIEQTSGTAMADGIREAFPEIFERNTKAYELAEDQIKEFVKGITELEESNSIIRLITRTFMELAKLGNFEKTTSSTPQSIEVQNPLTKSDNVSTDGALKFTYTIVLNLPSTTSKEIYDTLFKSLKENLLTG